METLQQVPTIERACSQIRDLCNQRQLYLPTIDHLDFLAIANRAYESLRGVASELMIDGFAIKLMQSIKTPMVLFRIREDLSCGTPNIQERRLGFCLDEENIGIFYGEGLNNILMVEEELKSREKLAVKFNSVRHVDFLRGINRNSILEKLRAYRTPQAYFGG